MTEIELSYLISLFSVGVSGLVIGIVMGAILVFQWATRVEKARQTAYEKLVKDLQEDYERQTQNNPDDENWLKDKLGQ